MAGIRKIVKRVAHDAWFGMEVNGLTAAGDTQGLAALYAEEHERIVTSQTKTDASK